MDKQQLWNPKLLQLNDPHGGFYMGGSQKWFKDSWKRTSGCAPTAASGILWYLARSRLGDALCETANPDQSSFLNLMDTIFDYVTPGIIGVNSVSAFERGILRYGDSRGIILQTRTITIPPLFRKRPSQAMVRGFILESLRANSPPAFLNLSNGSLTNLGSWHWVILIALDPDSMNATICDHGRARDICLGEWLKTTICGGGLVSVF